MKENFFVTCKYIVNGESFAIKIILQLRPLRHVTNILTRQWLMNKHVHKSTPPEVNIRLTTAASDTYTVYIIQYTVKPSNLGRTSVVRTHNMMVVR